MGKTSKIIAVVTVAVVLCFQAPAHAAMDYYTYGGFDPVTTAFRNIALIFGDNSYKGALFCFGMLGIFFGAAAAYLKIASGMSSNGFSWMIPIFTGMMVYAALFTRTDTLYVYDPVYNQTDTIGGLPVGVVYSAGVVNTIERFIINIFDTNASLPPNTACGALPPLKYQDQGGAVGMRALQASLGEYVQDTTASKTLIKYIDDCVMFELGRPGSTLTEEQLFAPGCGETFLDVLVGGQNPANYSVDYLTGDPAVGTVQSCTQIYSDLRNYYGNQANANRAVSNACGGTGFEDTARCQQLIGDMVQSSLGISLSPQQFVSNNTLANITAQVLSTAGTQSQAEYLSMLNQAQSGTSGGFMAGIMNPLMIDAYVAYSILLFPLLALFLVTPMWQKAFSMMLSLVIWTTLLRSLDVITFHMWVVQYQKTAAAALNNVGMGIEAAVRLPGGANKYLGSFASMRNSIFLLATAISGTLFKFGDSALSRLADRASAQNESIKEQIGDRGIAARDAMATETNAARATMLTALAGGSYISNLGRGMASEEFGRGASGMGKLDTYGGNVGAMVDGQRHVSGVQTSQHAGYANSMTLSDSFAQGINEAGSIQGAMSKLGRDGQLTHHLAALMTDRNIGDARGYEQSFKVAQEMGFKGGIPDFQQMMSEVGNLKGFSDAQGFKDVAQKYFDGDEAKAGQALIDIAAFQQAKHMGEVERVKAGTGEDAPGTGMAFGKASGDGDLSLMASDNVRRMLAQNAGYKGESGYYQFMHAQGGANLSAFTDASRAYGPVKHSIATDGSGRTIAQQEQGSVRDKQHMAALEKELQAAGFKNAAAGIHTEMKKGHGFDFTITRDGSGHITGFQASGGAATFSRDFRQTLSGRQDDFKDLTTRTTGTDVQDINRKVHVVDQGLRSTIGSQEWRGNRGIVENFHQSHYTDIHGEHTRYSWVDKAGHEHIVSGTDNGLIQMQVQKDGKFANLTIDPVSGEVLLEDTRSGKKDVLFADRTEIQQGTQVTGAANAAVGKIASTVGIDQKSAEAVVGTIQNVASDVLPFANAGASYTAERRAAQAAGKRVEELATRETERAAEKAATEAQRQVQNHMNRTAKILQHASKTSRLPKSGGSPLKPGR